MQATPQVGFPVTWGLIALIVLALAGLGLMTLLTVLIAAARSRGLGRYAKTLGLALLLVIPAVAIVAMVGFFVIGYSTVRVERSHDVRVESFPQSATRVEFRAGESPVPNSSRKVASSDDDIITGKSETAIPAVEATETAKAEGVAEEVTRSWDSQQEPWVPAALLLDLRLLKGVLHVRETLPQAPDWAKGGAKPTDSGVVVALSSQQFATLDEAEQQATKLAAAYVEQFYQKEGKTPPNWHPTASLIEQNGLKSIVGHQLPPRDFGSIQQPMYRVHLQLEMNSKLRQAVLASKHDGVVDEHLHKLGGWMGMFTVLLASTWSYLKLNLATNGQFATRLKLAIVAILGAVGLGVIACR